jgi:hypothetical protein
MITRAATLSTPASVPVQGSSEDAGGRLGEVRRQVRTLLEESPAFRGLPAEKQREIARHTVDVCNYLAAPEGIPGSRIASAQARALDQTSAGTGGAEDGIFKAQAAREGAAAAGALLQNVNFPDFVSQLIQGVFHSIVQSSIEQMEAYGRLVQSVAMTLNQFRDENVSTNQGRDHLVDQFPDLFRLDVDTGEDGEQPRVRLRDGVDEDAALKRVKDMPVEGEPISSLDEETIEEQLVPAARTQLATSRQQLLATMVLMGINRIIVTDGRIAAKVMFDFQARDNMKWARSATRFDYDRNQMKTTTEEESEREQQASDSKSTWTKDAGYTSERRDGGYYAKGKYKSVSEPMLTLASATQATTDAALQTKASLSGQVEVNFRSETFDLNKMADSFQIGQIQDAARPGQVRASKTGTTPAGTAPVPGSVGGTAPAPATAPQTTPTR